MIGLTDNPAFSLFVPKQGAPLGLYIAATIAIGLAFVFALTKVPTRYRKPMIFGITFLMGWFYFLEFALPGDPAAAPARNHLDSAARYLRIAQHDLDVIAARKGGYTGVTNGRERVVRSQKAINAAIAELARAESAINRLRPKVERKFQRESARAEQWARRNGVSSKLLERDQDTRKILNSRTSALKKQMDDLGAALAQIESARKAVRPVQSALESREPDTSALSVALSGGTEAAVLARTAISDNFLTPYKKIAADIVAVLGSFALGLGIYSLMSIHGKAIARKRPGWLNSLAFYIALTAMAAFGLASKYAAKGQVLQQSSKSAYDVLFEGGLTALQATMFSLVAFYIVSAAYRAFRVRSGEAALMMASAFLVMLSIIPLGVWLTSWLPTAGWAASLRLERIGDWILKVPNTAAQRGIAFGIGVGMLAMALRIWLSLERGSYFDKQV